MTTTEIARLPGYAARFTGRRWLLSRIGEWLTEDVRNGLLVTGPPGSGKSAIAAQLVKLSARDPDEAPGTPIPSGFLAYHHFCQARNGRSHNPLRFLEGLTGALVNVVGGFAPYLMDHSIPGLKIESSINIRRTGPGTQVSGVSIGALHIGGLVPRLAFDQMIARPLEELQVRRPIVVLVDALDEAVTEQDGGFVDLVGHMLDYGDTLPLRLILTARTNTAAVIDRLEVDAVDIANDAPLEEDDIRLYALDALRNTEHLAHAEREQLATRLSSAASGNFLYAEFELAGLHDDPQRWRGTELPHGLQDAYRSFLRREIATSRTDARWMRLYRPILGLLVVARGDGLTPELLRTVTQMSASEIEDTLLTCGPFLRSREGSNEIRLYHESFREFLARDSIYHVFPDEAAESLVRHCLTAILDRQDSAIDEYPLRYLIEHLRDLRRYEELVTLSLNERFLTAQDAAASRHELSLATRDAGLRAALIMQDTERFTAIAMGCGLTRDRIARITPMDALAEEGLGAALSIASTMGPEQRTMWYLALAVSPHTQPLAEDASAVFRELLVLDPSVLPQYWQDTAAALLARAIAVDRTAVLSLQEALLNNWGRQHLVNFLIDQGDLSAAAEVLDSFTDGDIWLRATQAVADEYFWRGFAADALAMIDAIVASVPWVSEHLSIYDGGEDAFLLSLCAGVPEAREKLFEAMATDDASVDRSALVIAARAALYFHHVGDHDAAAACLDFCVHKNTKAVKATSDWEQHRVEVDNGQSAAFAALYLAETFLYLGRLPEARQFLGRTADLKPPLTAMGGQWGHTDDTHDDPQHRFCLQGLTLRLSRAAARLGEAEIGRGAAQELMDLGARDAVRALLADIEVSAGDPSALRDKLTSALAWTRGFASGSSCAVEMQRLVRAPAVALLPEREPAANTVDTLLRGVLEQASRRDAILLFDCAQALATVSATLERNGLHGKAVEIIRQVRSWTSWLNQRAVLARLVEQLAARGAAAMVVNLLDGLDAKGLGTRLYENVWESQVADLILRTGDLDGAVEVLKALKPDGTFAALEHLRQLVDGPHPDMGTTAGASARLLWLASNVAARYGDDERAALLRDRASAAATQLVEAQRGDRETESSPEQYARASRLADAARQLAEMGLLEDAEEAFALASAEYNSAEFSWDTYRFAFVGIVQTHDERAGDQDSSVVSRITRRCDYLEGFAHSGYSEVVRAHVDILMQEVPLITSVYRRDEALRRVACMLGHLGLWSEARDVVDSMYDGRDSGAVDVLTAAGDGFVVGGATRALSSSDDLMDIVQLGCRSLNGALRTCAALGEALLPFDAAVERSFDALVSTAVRRAEAITDPPSF